MTRCLPCRCLLLLARVDPGRPKGGNTFSWIGTSSNAGSAKAFLEWAEYTGNLYGTPAKAVQEHLERGSDVVLEIELKGAKEILSQCPEAVMIFIVPPSLGELERRLRGRRTESEQAISSRLARAREELADVQKKVEQGLPPFHHVIVNDSVKKASEELAAIIELTREEDEQTDHR